GFTPLFNGKDLTGWRYTATPKDSLEGKTETSDGRIVVHDGVILMNEKDNKGKGGIKDLYTVKDFAKDFILRLEFRAAPKADSGVYIRGNQLQVRDFPTVGPYKPKGFKGSDWNELEIVVRAKVLITKVNGKTLTDADALDVTVNTVLKWIKQRGLPAQHVGGQYRFHRAELLEWATANRIKVSAELFDSVHDADDEPMPGLASAMEAGGIVYRLPGSTKEEALRALVATLPLPDGVDREVLWRLFMAREASASTAIGDGIALPHVRNPVVLNVA